MSSDTWLTISTWPLFQVAPLILAGYVLMRQPVNLVMRTEHPMFRRLVTLSAAFVVCRLFLSLSG